MADSSGVQWWQAVVSAIPGLGALGWAIFNKLDDGKSNQNISITHEGDDEAAAIKARANLDDATKEWFDNMRADLRDQRAARKEAEAEAALWEARARRADRGWLDLVHQIREERLSGERLPIPPLPRLEDPV